MWRDGITLQIIKARKGGGGLLRKVYQILYHNTEVAIKLSDGIAPALTIA